MPKLCVNIDHIATVREARKGSEPDPLEACKLAIESGADGITVHLREDRRHINDRDVVLISSEIKSFNSKNKEILFTLEMAATEEMFNIATKIKPGLITLVPEKRQELTTEGGLDVLGNKDYLKSYISELHKNDLVVSIFINPDEAQIKAAKEINADYIEIHTGAYAHNSNTEELQKVTNAISFAQKIGLKTNAGHGLNYTNTKPVAQIKGIDQLHIGHSIISKSVLIGIKNSVQEMKGIINS